MLPDLLSPRTKNNSRNKYQYWLTLHAPNYPFIDLTKWMCPTHFPVKVENQHGAVHVEVTGSTIIPIFCTAQCGLKTNIIFIRNAIMGSAAGSQTSLEALSVKKVHRVWKSLKQSINQEHLPSNEYLASLCMLADNRCHRPS